MDPLWTLYGPPNDMVVTGISWYRPLMYPYTGVVVLVVY